VSAGIIHRGGPYRSVEAVEFATLEWVDWFNHRRLPEPIGHIPPAKPNCATMRRPWDKPWRRASNKTHSGKNGAVQA
jgi:hypothetical protein